MTLAPLRSHWLNLNLEEQCRTEWLVSFEAIPNCDDHLLIPNVRPSSVGSSERVIISAALRGRVNGITECGNVFGLIGVMSMCSVHEVSSEGRSNRSTSTFSVFCSNGTENVSCGMLWSQLSNDKSESLKPTDPSNNLENVISCCEHSGAPVAFAWQ